MSLSSSFPELMLEQQDASEFSDVPDVVESGGEASNKKGEGQNGGACPARQFASEETIKVRRVRVLLVGVIILGIAVSLGTYFFVNNEAKNDYEISFDLFATAIEYSLENSAENANAALRNLAESISDSRETIKDRNTTFEQGDFPFVLVDMFETHGEHARERSKVEAILYAPLVPAEIRTQWETFSVAHQNWIGQSRAKFLDHLEPGKEPPVYIEGNISPYVYRRRNNIFPEETVENISAPVWYLSPPPFNSGIVNFDMMSNELYRETLLRAVTSKESVFSRVLDVEQFSSMQVADADHHQFHEQFTPLEPGSIGYDHPHSIYARPVFASTRSEQVVGLVLGAIAWDAYFANLLPTGVRGVIAVLRVRCSHSPDQNFSYELNGPIPTYLGEGEMRNQNDHSLTLVRSISLFTVMTGHHDSHGDTCSYSVDVFPSQTFKEQYDSNSALVAACSLGGTFLIVALVFFGYDYVVNKRNQKVTAAAEKSDAIVSSLFPKNVRDRLYEEDKDNKKAKAQRHKSGDIFDAKDGSPTSSRPIAELFPESTILFADIRGFTSWSSAREPAQVFELLETIYAAFDNHAARRGVYKIETIGDCYVAVCGVPNPNKNHAVVMTRFARDCIRSFSILVEELESTLGPDTSDLQLRVGLHSGPVTGGVLRGDRARFQLFGDSMNTASRMESNGVGGKIHCSKATADLLISDGKGAWLTVREDKVVAKGKGEMITYWVSINSKATSSNESDSHSSDKTDDFDFLGFDNRTERWIDFNAGTLEIFLKKIVASRKPECDSCKVPTFVTTETVPMDELREVIDFPEVVTIEDDTSTELGSAVTAQLKAFVSCIASMYREVPFHNFEHASHVVMSAVKLLHANKDVIKQLDPLTQFALVLSALIHDVDHQGVANSQLAKEVSSMNSAYKGQSLAEQNSFDLSWNMLMHNDFQDLRQTICQTQDNWKHFRQVMVNAVLSTDLFDPKLNNFRSLQWQSTFANENKEMAADEHCNRKATIVIGLLIQASDVAHCFQHFETYRKWNTRLFCEMAAAHRDGRSSRDPATFWYKGELQFFDNHVLPLADKLRDCGGFGATAAEYLDYALENRREWERRGHALVEEMKFLAAAEAETKQ